MTTELFAIQLVASFIIGGFVIALAITAGEKFGPKIGGIILMIPSTSLVSFFFIGLVNSKEYIQNIVPFSIIGMAIFMVFIGVFIAFVEKFGKGAIGISLLVWFLLAFLALAFPITNLGIALIIFLGVYLAINIYFKKNEMIARVKPLTNSKIFIYRMLFAGTTVSCVVFLSKTLGPAWGGLFTMFPAATMTSFWLMLSEYPKEFARSVALKILAPSIIITLYATAAYFIYPLVGIYLGTIICVVFNMCIAFIFSKILK